MFAMLDMVGMIVGDPAALSARMVVLALQRLGWRSMTRQTSQVHRFWSWFKPNYIVYASLGFQALVPISGNLGRNFKQIHLPMSAEFQFAWQSLAIKCVFGVSKLYTMIQNIVA